MQRIASGLAPIGAVMDQVIADALSAPRAAILPGSAAARQRVNAQSTVERIIQRALWRAERRGRAVPRHVRQSSRWVFAQRRKIAYDVVRAFHSLGLGTRTANVLAERAAARFPRDGIVLSESTERAERPRARGESPRQQGHNPRATGTNPREQGTNPRARQQLAPPA